MEAERWRRVTELFEACMAVPSGDRLRFLEERAPDDTGLVREVLELIGADEQPGEYMEPPDKADLRTGATGSESLVGERLGPYLLERIIGRGGMGAVYQASRVGAGFDQQVAIKLIRRGMDTDDILRRFQNERQVLAGLTHPGIARLLDGGASEDGRPYLVMEIVDGVRIDSYCNGNQLDIEARLRVFLKVCDAIQHAHERRIVHRDLKPSNILVTSKGQPKLLDFGISKLLDSTGSVLTVDVTATELRLMTPEYASPEQVRSGKVDTRSDIYSLGVILYELLTGHRPYRATTGLRRDLERAICEEDPVRPSRMSNTAPVRTRLAGDLDTILLMSLRKEPARRYATVAKFAEDIERHLAGHPVRARRDTWHYRTTKFVRRNSLLVASACVVLLVLLAGLFGTFSMFLEAEDERAEAVAREYVARISAAASSLRADDAAAARQHLEAAPAERRGWEWRHFMARTDESVTTLSGHEGEITALSWNRSGAALASGSTDRRVLLWDVASEQVTRSWELPSRVVSLHFSEDGERLLAAAEGRAVWMLDAGSETPRWTREGPVLKAVFAPSGTTVVWVENDRILFLSSADGAVTDQLEQEGLQYESVAFNEVGSELFFGSGDGVLGTWDLEDRSARVLAAEEEVVGPLHWIGKHSLAAAGAALIVGTSDGRLQVWDSIEGVLTFETRAHADRVMSVCYDQVGARIITTSMDRSIKLWDVETGALLDTLLGHTTKVMRSAFCEASNMLATGSGDRDRAIKLWNLSRPPSRIEADRGWTMGLGLHPDGTRVAASSWDRWKGPSVGVACWDLSERRLLWRKMRDSPRSEGRANAARLVWSADGERIFSSAPDGSIGVWDADSGDLLDIWQVGENPLTLALTPDGTRLAAAYDRVALLDVEDGTVIRSFSNATSRIESLAFSPDGEQILTSSSGAAQLWSVTDGVAIGELPASRVPAVAIAPDGEQLATSGGDTVIRLWNRSDLTLQAELHGHTIPALDLAYSPDGQRLASCALDTTVRLWDPQEGRELATLYGHEAAVTEVEFSRDGRSIVSQDRHGVIRIWDAPQQDLEAE